MSEMSLNWDVPTALREVFGYDIAKSPLGQMMNALEWAEDEIAKAEKEWPEKTYELYHAFTLLQPRSFTGYGSIGKTEFVYRGHCRELLARVAADEDTRPATYAEMAIACCETSQMAPFNMTGAGFYARVWTRAFPEKPCPLLEDVEPDYYDRRLSHAIDDVERTVRRKMSDPSRAFKHREITCQGQHHGEPAPFCPFHTEPLVPADNPIADVLNAVWESPDQVLTDAGLLDVVEHAKEGRT